MKYTAILEMNTRQSETPVQKYYNNILDNFQ